jgi:hypothetical protein
MKLNKSSWHYKLYAFNSQMVAKLWDEGDFHEYPHHGNIIGLCPYMRMILIWGPLAFLCNLIPLAGITWFFIVLPAFTVGLWSLLMFVSYVCAISGLTIALYFCIRYLIKRYSPDNQATRKADKLERIAQKVGQPDTFRSLLVGYIKSVKTKVCPVLELDNE